MMSGAWGWVLSIGWGWLGGVVHEVRVGAQRLVTEAAAVISSDITPRGGRGIKGLAAP